MASERDDNRSFEGVRIELPFVSFGIGRASATPRSQEEDDDAYLRGRRRVRARLGFYRHVATYAALMAAVIFFDLITGGGISSPVLWVAGIWGALIVWQFFNVFVFPSVWSRETEERMIEEEMRRNEDL
jgi:fatty acid desaturase